MRFVTYLGGLLRSAGSVWPPLARLSSVTGLCCPGLAKVIILCVEFWTALETRLGPLIA